MGKPNRRAVPLLVLLILPLLLSSIAAQTHGQEQRTWTSKNGKFKKQATLVELNTEKVTLKLEGGEILEVPVASLSVEDQKYIQSLEETPADIASGKSDSIVKLRGRRLGAELNKRIDEFQGEQEPSGEVLKVIYFHAKDSQPEADYQQRLHRILHDIQDFYYDEMRKNGFSTSKLPLELENGQLVVHVVTGQDRNSDYSHHSTSARKIRKECALALKGKVDFESDFTLIFCGLVVKQNQQYIFNAPAYGLPSDHVKGCCFMPDCDKLDPNFIKDTRSSISYVDNGKLRKLSLARFTSTRIGTTAHELGHALSLPHNGQTASEFSKMGKALMGNGNNTYRKEQYDRKNKGCVYDVGFLVEIGSSSFVYW